MFRRRLIGGFNASFHPEAVADAEAEKKKENAAEDDLCSGQRFQWGREDFDVRRIDKVSKSMRPPMLRMGDRSCRASLRSAKAFSISVDSSGENGASSFSAHCLLSMSRARLGAEICGEKPVPGDPVLVLKRRVPYLRLSIKRREQIPGIVIRPDLRRDGVSRRAVQS